MKLLKYVNKQKYAALHKQKGKYQMNKRNLGYVKSAQTGLDSCAEDFERDWPKP